MKTQYCVSQVIYQNIMKRQLYDRLDASCIISSGNLKGEDMDLRPVNDTEPFFEELRSAGKSVDLNGPDDIKRTQEMNATNEESRRASIEMAALSEISSRKFIITD